MTGTAAIARKYWRPRLWQLLLGCALVLLLATWVALLVVRAAGRARWTAFVAAEQAAGRPLALDHFLAAVPPVDAAAQAQWSRWEQALAASMRAAGKPEDTPQALTYDSPATRPRHRLAAWAAGRGPRPADIDALLSRWEPDLAPARAALRSGRLALSAYGWAGEMLRPGAGRARPDAAFLHGPNQGTVALLGDWLHHHALLSDDPAADLADLDALHAALARPAILQDAVAANLLGGIRDRAYLELAVGARLPAAARERWLAEPGRAVELVGEGLVGMRIVSAAAYATSFDVGLVGFIDTHGPSDWWRHPGSAITLPWIWATIWHDLPPMTAFTGEAAASLRGVPGAPYPDPRAFRDSLTWCGRYTIAPRLSYIATYASNAAAQDANHRQARLAARILALAPAGGLPVDQADLLARLDGSSALLVATNRYTLRYERLAADRFRVAIDPGSPLPDFAGPQQLAELVAAAAPGPATAPLIIGTAIEIQLPPTP